MPLNKAATRSKSAATKTTDSAQLDQLAWLKAAAVAIAEDGFNGTRILPLSKRLGVTRVALSRVLNGKAGISADMAVRLAAGLGGSAESWLHMQANYDLSRAEKVLKREIAKIQQLKLAA